MAELEALVAESHSRIPVTGTSAGDVVGFDLLRFGADDRDAPVPLEMVRH